MEDDWISLNLSFSLCKMDMITFISMISYTGLCHP